MQSSELSFSLSIKLAIVYLMICNNFYWFKDYSEDEWIGNSKIELSMQVQIVLFFGEPVGKVELFYFLQKVAFVHLVELLLFY